MAINDYEPYWPENVIFWGAGATYSLGMKTTMDIGKAISILTDLEMPIYDRVDQAFGDIDEEIKNGIVELIFLISYSHHELLAFELSKRGSGPDIDERIKQLYNDILHNNNIPDPSHGYSPAAYLHEVYDWTTLCKIVDICPGAHTEAFQLQDLFNILDLHIQGGQGFRAIDNSFISITRIIKAKNTLKMLLILFHSVNYSHSLSNEGVFKPYIEFAKALAELMLDEGRRRQNEGKKINKRDFYLFSYSVVSMNWDPILLWLLFMAHKEINEDPDNVFDTICNDKNIPLKLFHDLGNFMAVRSIGGDTPDIWYPMNETVVQRINDPEHELVTRRVRVGKFYFPHGMHGFRECPNCGKLMVYLGDEWNWLSKSLFPPALISSLDIFNFKTKSPAESLARSMMGQYDVMQCVYCGQKTETQHTPLVMQSSFKGNHPPYIEEIQRDMRVSIEKANHIILMGYSLPPDDVIYRSMLSARKKRTEPIKCSVVVGIVENAPDEWLLNERLDNVLNENPNSSFTKVIQTARELFGKDNVRGYAAGIPQVFSGENSCEVKKKVNQILNFSI